MQRDAGSAVDRVLRVCVVARLVHIARISPPSFSVTLLKHLDLVVNYLHAWKQSSFWNEIHEASTVESRAASS